MLAKKNIFFPRLESGLLQDEKLIFLSYLSGTEVLFAGRRAEWSVQVQSSSDFSASLLL